MQLSEKAAYIKGLIDGLDLDPKDKQAKILRLMADLLGEMALEIKDLEQCYDDVCDQVDGISEDLAGVEDVIYDEGTDCGFNYSKPDEYDNLEYEVTCPECGKTICLSEESLNQGSLKCPECGEVLVFDYSEDELDDTADTEETSEEE